MSSKRITLISHWKKLVHQPVNLNVPINLIDSWHSLPCTVCGSVSYKKTKQDKKKKKKKKNHNKRSLSGWAHMTGCLTGNSDEVSETGGGGVRGWNFATGTKEDLCLLLWQHDSQLRRQYEATRRDELLVQDCLSFFFFFCPPPFHKRKWDSVCVWKKIGGKKQKQKNNTQLLILTVLQVFRSPFERQKKNMFPCSVSAGEDPRFRSIRHRDQTDRQGQRQ